MKIGGEILRNLQSGANYYSVPKSTVSPESHFVGRKGKQPSEFFIFINVKQKWHSLPMFI